MFRLLLVLGAFALCSSCGVPQDPILGGDDGGTSTFDTLDDATSAISDPTETEEDDPPSSGNSSDDPELPDPTVPDQSAGLIDGDIFDGTGVDPGCGAGAECGSTLPAPELGVAIERIDPGVAGAGAGVGAIRQ